MSPNQKYLKIFWGRNPGRDLVKASAKKSRFAEIMGMEQRLV